MGRKDQIRLVIADDHRRFREGLVELLRREEAIEVVGEAANGREVLKALEEFHPDVLLLDLFMPEMDGLDVLPQIREHNSSTKVLILTGYFDQELVFRSLWEGARGYLQKNVSSAELLKAIRAVHAGEAWIERGVMGHLLEELPRQENRVSKRGQSAQLLSQREAETARFVAAAPRHKEVGDWVSIR